MNLASNPNLNMNMSQNINPNFNPNPNMNQNINIGGNYNSHNPGVQTNNRQYNRKFNNNMSMPGMNNSNNMNNSMYKMKYLKSDKFMNNTIKDGRTINQMSYMMNMNMIGNPMGGQAINGPMHGDFSAPRIPNQNKVWRNNNNHYNNFPGNQSKINELTNIINSTIRDPGSNQSKSNKNMQKCMSFDSIKEEHQSVEKVKCKDECDFAYSSENSAYEMAEEEVKTTRFTLASRAASRTFSVPVTFTSWVSSGSAQDCGTEAIAAKWKT
jgi:hypothetical protein